MSELAFHEKAGFLYICRLTGLIPTMGRRLPRVGGRIGIPPPEVSTMTDAPRCTERIEGESGGPFSPSEAKKQEGASYCRLLPCGKCLG
jgi:hypothetical protein